MFWQVEGVEASDEIERRRESSTDWRADGAARARLDAGGAHAGLLGGSPLTLLQGIIPGEILNYSVISAHISQLCMIIFLHTYL